MTKQSILIAILLCGSCLTTAAQDVVVKNLEGPSARSQCNLHDLIYADHTATGPSKVKQLAAPKGDVVNYKDRIVNMPQYLCNFIDAYVKAGQEVLNGGTNWLSDPQMGDHDSNSFYYLLDELKGSAPFSFAPGSSDETIREAAYNAIANHFTEEYDILESFLPYACLSLNFDHPEIFWTGNSFHYGYSGGWSYSYYYSGTGTAEYTMTLKFVLHSNADGFDIRNNGISGYDFRYPEQLAQGIQLFHTSKQNILKECQTGSRYDKLLAAHDWLTHHNCYNPFFASGSYGQNEIGDTPWSALSALEGNNDQKAPVCEGYSRAFKVLCDAMNIPCILMGGNARDRVSSSGEPHMWNYVQMENGKWYAIDVTWDDPLVNYQNNTKVVSGFESHNWFLLGSTTDVGGFSFIESHPEQWETGYDNNGSHSWELLSGPVLDPLNWTPEEAGDPYDINRDGIVDEKDIYIMAEDIASCNESTEDLDGNGRISIGDLMSLINHYLAQ